MGANCDRIHLDSATPQDMLDELNRRGAKAVLVYWKEGEERLVFMAPEGGGRTEFVDFRSTLSGARDAIESKLP